jgi:large subunit ribosomal protein L23
MHTYDVLCRPLITEKGSIQQIQGKYLFEVDVKATKTQVKQAVEKSFNVSVTQVNVVTMRGKMRRMGRGIFKTPDWKKAIVTLKAGDKIELFEGV